MAFARFDAGVDFRTLFTGTPLYLALDPGSNLSVSATGLTTTVYPDYFTFISDGGISTVYPAFFGSGLTMVDNSVVGGTFNAYHYFDGADFNEYISGFWLNATAINLVLEGDTVGFIRAMLGEDDRITLRGGTLANYVFADAGNDTISGALGKDSLFGEAGNDLITGSGGNDRLYGGTGSDTLNGGFGRDGLTGGDGADRLFGAAGNDTLRGGVGGDRLAGGLGDGTLRGGAGADRFLVSLSDGQNVIADYEDGIDKILVAAGSGTVALAFEDTGPDVLVTFNSTEILVKNIAFGQKSQADFQLI